VELRRLDPAFIDSLTTDLEKIETRQIGTYSKFVHQVATREDCVAFYGYRGCGRHGDLAAIYHF